MPSSSAQPLSRYRIWDSEEADEIQARLAAFYNDTAIRIEPLNRHRSVSHEMFATSLGGITLNSLTFPLGVRASAPLLQEAFDFCSAHRGSAEFKVGGKSHSFDRTNGVILSPNEPFEVCSDGFVSLNISVPRSLLEAQIRALTGCEITEPVEFDSAIDLTSKTMASIWRFVGFTVAEIERENSLLTNPLVGERFCETVLTGLLCSQTHTYSQLLQRDVFLAEPHYIHQIEEHLDAHCEQPITGRDLAAIAGIGVSSLYAGFKRHRGYTPLHFLRNARLRRVRDALLTTPRKRPSRRSRCDAVSTTLGGLAESIGGGMENPPQTHCGGERRPIGRALEATLLT